MSHPLRPPGVTLGPNLWSASWHSQSERGPNRSFGMDKSHPEFERFDNATRKAVVWDASMLFIQLIARDGTIDQFMLDTMMQWYYCCFKKKGSLNLTEHVTFCCPFSSYILSFPSVWQLWDCPMWCHGLWQPPWSTHTATTSMLCDVWTPSGAAPVPGAEPNRAERYTKITLFEYWLVVNNPCWLSNIAWGLYYTV